MEMTDEVLLDRLKPSFPQGRGEAEITELIEREGEALPSDLPDPTESKWDPVPSPDSVNMLFYPWVRQRIREWQATFFNTRLSSNETGHAKEQIEKVIRALLFQGAGRPTKIDRHTASRLFLEYPLIDRRCREIFSTASNSGTRRSLVEEAFPGEAAAILEEWGGIKSAAQLRNAVLAKRCECTLRVVEEFLRKKYAIFKYFRKDPNVKEVTIDYEDKKTIITLAYEDGRRVVRSKSTKKKK